MKILTRIFILSSIFIYSFALITHAKTNSQCSIFSKDFKSAEAIPNENSNELDPHIVEKINDTLDRIPNIRTQVKEQIELQSIRNTLDEQRMTDEIEAMISSKQLIKAGAIAKVTSEAEIRLKRIADLKAAAEASAIEKANEAEKIAAEAKANGSSDALEKEKLAIIARSTADAASKENSLAQIRAEEMAAKAKSDAEAKAKAELAAEKARIDAENAAEQARIRSEAESRAKAEAESKAAAEAESRAKAEAESIAKAEAESIAKAESESESIAKAEAESRAKVEIEARLSDEAEEIDEEYLNNITYKEIISADSSTQRAIIRQVERSGNTYSSWLQSKKDASKIITNNATGGGGTISFNTNGQ